MGPAKRSPIESRASVPGDAVEARKLFDTRFYSFYDDGTIECFGFIGSSTQQSTTMKWIVDTNDVDGLAAVWWVYFEQAVSKEMMSLAGEDVQEAYRTYLAKLVLCDPL